MSPGHEGWGWGTARERVTHPPAPGMTTSTLTCENQTLLHRARSWGLGVGHLWGRVAHGVAAEGLRHPRGEHGRAGGPMGVGCEGLVWAVRGVGPCPEPLRSVSPSLAPSLGAFCYPWWLVAPCRALAASRPPSAALWRRRCSSGPARPGGRHRVGRAGQSPCQVGARSGSPHLHLLILLTSSSSSSALA